MCLHRNIKFENYYITKLLLTLKLLHYNNECISYTEKYLYEDTTARKGMLNLLRFDQVVRVVVTMAIIFAIFGETLYSVSQLAVNSFIEVVMRILTRTTKGLQNAQPRQSKTSDITRAQFHYSQICVQYEDTS